MDLRRLPSPDDLLILLTVARLGRFNAVAETLGMMHTTISHGSWRWTSSWAGAPWSGARTAGS